MPSSIDMGFTLFWLGACFAYAGTWLLPSLGNNRKTALGLLVFSGVYGWVAMLAAENLFDYGRSWLDMHASWMALMICSLVGAVRIPSKTKEEKQ